MCPEPDPVNETDKLECRQPATDQCFDTSHKGRRKGAYPLHFHVGLRMLGARRRLDSSVTIGQISLNAQLLVSPGDTIID